MCAKVSSKLLSISLTHRYIFDEKYNTEVTQHIRPSLLEFRMTENTKRNYLFSEYHVVLQLEERPGSVLQRNTRVSVEGHFKGRLANICPCIVKYILERAYEKVLQGCQSPHGKRANLIPVVRVHPLQESSRRHKVPDGCGPKKHLVFCLIAIVIVIVNLCAQFAWADLLFTSRGCQL